MNRRNFLFLLSLTSGAGFRSNDYFVENGEYIMTVNGKIPADFPGIMLPHEHITTDFIGAEKVAQPQYDRDEAFQQILPYLIKLKNLGVTMMAECTPNYIGRDVVLLQRLSSASGIKIITNTGYYAAVEFKYLPKHAFTETSDQIAGRWLKEWNEGIDGTGIRPGFIKLGVGKGPLKEVERKLIIAAAKVHLKTGLKIGIHTGDGVAAKEEFELLSTEKVKPDAFIWIHAQNDEDGKIQLELARKGCWISLDGVGNTDASILQYTKFLEQLKKENLMRHILISHDDGWSVDKDEQTAKVSLSLFKKENPMPYTAIFNKLKPHLLARGFTEAEFEMMMVRNPKKAFEIKVKGVR